MSEPHVMTIEEANALVPRLSLIVERQLRRASEIEAKLKRLRSMQPEALAPRPGASALGASPSDSDEVRSLKRDIEAQIEAYERSWQEVEDLGVVVKDPRVGLCDFYGRVEGKLVWLCWRYGEPSVEHYHDLDAGFSGRKPLTGAVRRALLN
jgi:hypothetical protein